MSGCPSGRFCDIGLSDVWWSNVRVCMFDFLKTGSLKICNAQTNKKRVSDNEREWLNNVFLNLGGYFISDTWLVISINSHQRIFTLRLSTRVDLSFVISSIIVSTITNPKRWGVILGIPLGRPGADPAQWISWWAGSFAYAGGTYTNPNCLLFYSVNGKSFSFLLSTAQS